MTRNILSEPGALSSFNHSNFANTLYDLGLIKLFFVFYFHRKFIPDLRLWPTAALINIKAKNSFMLNYLPEMCRFIHTTRNNTKIHISAGFHKNRTYETAISNLFANMRKTVKLHAELPLRTHSNYSINDCQTS